MGCDIHLNAEIRRERWLTIPDPIRKCWCRRAPERQAQAQGSCGACEGKGLVRQEWYAGRHYTLFAVLADVRNGGVLSPIVSPRGLPKDVCKRSHHAIHGGDHSHSWLTLEEIVDWPGWDAQQLETRNWLTPEGYAALLKERAGALPVGSVYEHRPRSEDGPHPWITLTNTEMESVVESGVMLPFHRTEAMIQVPIRRICKGFFQQTVRPLREIARKRGVPLSHIRLVFSFDN